MKYTNVLHEEISAVWKIFTTAQESFLFAKYFSEKQDAEGISPFKSSSFRYIKRVMFKDAVIELFKIYSKGDGTSIEKVKTKIKKNEYNIEVDNLVFEEISNQIKSNQSIIEKINTNRKYRFAHHEEEIEVDSLLLEEIESLLESTKRIIKTVYFLCFDSQTEFRPLHFDPRQLDYLIKLADEDHEKKFQSIINKQSR